MIKWVLYACMANTAWYPPCKVEISEMYYSQIACMARAASVLIENPHLSYARCVSMEVQEDTGNASEQPEDGDPNPASGGHR